MGDQDEAADLRGTEVEAPACTAFPIVGVGASAGGLTPTIELLRQLGPQPEIALVIVHHLDPTHESALVEILGRATTMPVTVATDGLPVAKNHVYVVPPNAGLLIEQGALKVAPRIEEGGLHLPIDRFLESLALDARGCAIGVVLSGSGYDGTAGVKAIKSEGGIAFAQDASAQYPSMPQSAIATGCVDVILPPGGIARELVRIGAQPERLVMVRPRTLEDPEYLKILAMVRRSSGVDFTSYKHSTIQRRLQRRLVLHGLNDLAGYIALLQREPAEISALCEEVLIHVTEFFREPESFAALTATVLPRLCEGRRHDSPLRIWVPGCSSGEEVYSLAICVLEYLEETNNDLRIKIFGTDLSIGTIEQARAGRYPESIARDVSPDRLRRFFSTKEGGHRIRGDVRDLCVFARHDITRDPPFSSIDLISCRNLMIYLGPTLQDRVIGLLHYALNEPGFLMLGSAETVRSFSGFAAVDERNKIYARTSSAPRLSFDFTTPRLTRDFTFPAREEAGLPNLPGATTSSSPDVHREADRLVLAEYAPPGVVVTDDLSIVQFRGQTGLFLEPAPGAASLNLLRMAREELRVPLRRLLDQARTTQSASRETGLKLEVGEASYIITIEVVPFAVHPSQQRFYVVLFEDETPKKVLAPAAKPPVVLSARAERAAAEDRLKQELASTRQYLESVIEQGEATNEELKASNEEVVSSNEELRSTNEELQSAKEELQATNEELRTVNDEMAVRHSETTRLNDDLTNVLSSVEIPIIILGRNSQLRRYTPAAARVFGCLPADLGRPIGDVRPIVVMVPAITWMIAEVLASLRPAECATQDEAGSWYQITVRPYVTLDGRIDGTVLTAQDVDVVKRGGERLAEARKYAESIVNTVREGLVVVDRQLHVHSGNKAFQRVFHLTPKEMEARRLDELGRVELAHPALRKLVTELGEGDTVEDFRMEHKDAAGGERVFMLNARHIEATPLVLVAIEDVSEIERAATAGHRAELGLRDILIHASEAIFMLDAAGTIMFVNHAAAAMFGYSADELAGTSVDVLVPERARGGHAGLRAGFMAAPSPRPMARDRELTGRRKDGTELPIEVVLSPATTADGPRVMAFVADVASRRAADKRLHEYQDKLQQMAFDQTKTEEAERRRIAVELHDMIGQSLALAEIKLTSVRDAITGPPRAAVDEAIGLLDRSIIETRSLTFELSPPVLYDLGLEKALSWLAEDVEKRQGLRVELADDGTDKPLDDTTKALVFRAVREILMNVCKHAKTSTAKVSLRRVDHQFEIAIEDAGVGFDPQAVSDRTGSDSGFGLLSVRDQLRRLGGTLELTSAAGKGTRVKMRLPLAAGAAPSEKSTP